MAFDKAPADTSQPGSADTPPPPAPPPGRRGACVAPCLLLLVLSQCAILGLLFCAHRGRIQWQFPGMGRVVLDLSPLIVPRFPSAPGRAEDPGSNTQLTGPGTVHEEQGSDSGSQEGRVPHVQPQPEPQTQAQAGRQGEGATVSETEGGPHRIEGVVRDTAVESDGTPEGGRKGAEGAAVGEGEVWAPQRVWVDHSGLGFASFSAYQVNPSHFVVLGHSLYPSEIERVETAPGTPKRLGCTWSQGGRETQGVLSTLWLELETAFGRFDYTLLILICRLNGRQRARNGLGKAWSKLKWTLLPSGQRSSRKPKRRGRSMVALGETGTPTRQAQQGGFAGIPGVARRHLLGVDHSQGQGQGQSGGVLRLIVGQYAFSMHPDTLPQGWGQKKKQKTKGQDQDKGDKVLTFCGPPMYGPMHPQSVFQWLVYHQQTLVFDHVFLYNVTAVSPAMVLLLRPYLDSGLVSVTDFSGVLQYSSLSQGLFTAVNDCLHRNRGLAAWVAYMDFDEYLVVKDLRGGIQPTSSVRQFLKTRMEGYSHFSHGCYSFALLADEPPWEASEKKLAVELMRFHDASPYCISKKFRPHVCPRHYGYRKMIVDTGRVCLVHLHHVDVRQTKRLRCPAARDMLLSTSEVYHGHYRGMTTKPINMTGPGTRAFVKRERLVPTVDVAYAAAKAREHCLSSTGLKQECALPPK